MEREEQKRELFEVEQQEQEEEETTLLVRKSRTENDIKAVEADVEVSNGVSHTNGHAKTESLLTENGAKDEEPVLGIEQKIEELDGVLENGPESKNGDQKSQNLVFHDEVEGIWKCRICTWTYQNGSVCVNHIQNHKGQLHKLMNVKTLNFETEGIEPASAYSGEEQTEKDFGHDKLDISLHDYVVKDNSAEVSDSNGGHFEDNGLFSLNLEPSQSLYQEESSKYKSSNEIESADVDLANEDEIESAGVDLTNEDDLEAPDLDVEKVLKEQKSHDLYCPNCNSCITRRVILRKRKRRIRISDEEVKRNKIEAATDTKLGTGLVQASNNEVGLDETRIPTVDDDERERGPDIFRCLSCFSFFIPTGNGFKLFRGSGGERVKENVGVEQVPNTKKYWFSFMFASNRQETAVEQGSSSKTDEQISDVGVASSSLSDQSVQPSSLPKPPAAHTSGGVVGTAKNNGTLEGRYEILRVPRQEPSLNGKVMIGAGEKLNGTLEKIDATIEQFDAFISNQLKEPKSEFHVNHDNNLSVKAPPKGTQKESIEDAILFSQGGLKLPISSNKGSPVPANSDWEIFEHTSQIGGTDKEASQLLPPSVSVHTGSDKEGKLNISVAIPHEEHHVGTTITTEYVENKHTNFSSSITGSTEVSQQITTTAKYEIHTEEALNFDSFSPVDGASVSQGKDTVITIDAQSANSSETPQSMIIPRESATAATQIFVGDRERTQVINETKIEVIKSIVYGGLAESVTSLSVVSSAAGGDTATLNIVALGMANLVGGLFIICHNLWELRSDSTASSQMSNQINEPRDRYKELLGRRQNFILHAVVSIISYIIFGLLPPVVYGFSFRKSDDKEFKLLVVAAVSLVCIMMLAIGRAYVQRPPKRYLKTVLTFVILAIMVSGVSYAAGILVERLLEKLGLFQTSSTSNLVLLSETMGKDSTWGSI